MLFSQAHGASLLVFLGIFLLDTYLKTTLSTLPSLVLIPGVLGLHVTYNTGVAFSLLHNTPPFVTLGLTFIILMALTGWLLFYPKQQPILARLAVLLIVAGGLNNWLDRLQDGKVTDYLELLFVSYPIFNVSDIAIVSGCCLLAICLLFSSSSTIEKSDETA